MESAPFTLSVRAGPLPSLAVRPLLAGEAEKAEAGGFERGLGLTNKEAHDAKNHNILAFTHPNDQTIFFYNISNNETAKMQADPSSRVTFHFRVSPDDNQILGTMFTDRRDPNSRVLFVYDVETSEVRHIKIPGKRPDLAEIRGWVDHEEFIVILRSDDGDSQAVRINSMTGEITGHIPQVYTPP